MATALFWINKDASSETLSHSSRAQRSAIQSQIQRGRPRKRAPKSKPAKETISAETAAPTRPMELYDTNMRSMTVTLDPFDTTCVNIDFTARGLLRYYVYYAHPSMWPNVPITLGGAYAYKSSVGKIVSAAMEDKLVMFCLLTSASCRMQYVDHLSFPNVAKNEHGYSQKAVELMHSRVREYDVQRSGDMNLLLQCIAYLVAGESYRENFGVSRIHLQGAWTLLNQIGGIENLECPFLQGQLLMADLFLACVEMTPCVSECFYDPGPASVLRLQTHELQDGPDFAMGSFLLTQDTSIIPPALKILIEEILDTYQTKTRLYTPAMSYARIMETGQWVTARNMAIRNKLLALSYDDIRLDCLRATLIMWTLLAMNITGRIKTVKLMAGRLRSMITNMSSEALACDPDLLLWILVVGYGCAPVRSELAEWFQEQIREQDIVRGMIDVAQLSDACLVEGLEKFQRRFLYHAMVQRPISQELVRVLQKASNTDE